MRCSVSIILQYTVSVSQKDMSKILPIPPSPQYRIYWVFKSNVKGCFHSIIQNDKQIKRVFNFSFYNFMNTWAALRSWHWDKQCSRNWKGVQNGQACYHQTWKQWLNIETLAYIEFSANNTSTKLGRKELKREGSFLEIRGGIHSLAKYAPIPSVL